MPIYEYQCKHCEAVFEVRATFKEKEAGLKPECPQCHRKQARQLLTSTLFLRRSEEGKGPAWPGCGPNAGPGCCSG